MFQSYDTNRPKTNNLTKPICCVNPRDIRPRKIDSIGITVDVPSHNTPNQSINAAATPNNAHFCARTRGLFHPPQARRFASQDRRPPRARALTTQNCASRSRHPIGRHIAATNATHQPLNARTHTHSRARAQTHTRSGMRAYENAQHPTHPPPPPHRRARGRGPSTD